MSYLKYSNPMTPEKVSPGVPDFNHPYPRIILTETTGGLPNPLSRWTKWIIAQVQSYGLRKAVDINAIHPILWMRQCNLAYLGYEGNSKDPGDAGYDPNEDDAGKGNRFISLGPTTDGYDVYAGHWLYDKGTVLSVDLSSTGTTVYVKDDSYLTSSRYAMIHNGDFSNAELVKLVSGKGDKYTITRGFKSTPLAHNSGSKIAMVVKAQATVDPTGQNFMYNLSSLCPKDAAGNRYVEFIAQWLADNMLKGPDGVAIPGLKDTDIIGIGFDIDFNYQLTAKNADCNNDGFTDHGIDNTGFNFWGRGIEIMYEKYRTINPHHISSGGIVESWGYGVNNGVQLEGWPSHPGTFHSWPPDYTTLGLLIANYTFRHRYNEGPMHVQCLCKSPSIIYPKGTKVDSNRAIRFSLGTALLMDGYWGTQNASSSNYPPNPDMYEDPWYDEMSVDMTPGPGYGVCTGSNPSDETKAIAGAGWLGYPKGDYIRVFNDADFQPNNRYSHSFEDGIAGWVGVNADVSQSSDSYDGAYSIKGSLQRVFNSSLYKTAIKGPSVSLVIGREYTFTFAAKVSRYADMKVYLGGGEMRVTLSHEWRRYIMSFTCSVADSPARFTYGLENVELWVDDVELFEGNTDVFSREFDNGIVFANARKVPVTIPLPRLYQRLKGTQDPVNDGAKVTSVTVPPEDAVFLINALNAYGNIIGMRDYVQGAVTMGRIEELADSAYRPSTKNLSFQVEGSPAVVPPPGLLTGAVIKGTVSKIMTLNLAGGIVDSVINDGQFTVTGNVGSVVSFDYEVTDEYGTSDTKHCDVTVLAAPCNDYSAMYINKVQLTSVILDGVELTKVYLDGTIIYDKSCP